MFLEELGMVSGAEWGVRKPQLRYVIYPSVRHKAKKNKRKKRANISVAQISLSIWCVCDNRILS